MTLQVVLALPAPRFGAGPLKENVLTVENRDRNILILKEQMRLISEHFEGDRVSGVTFLTNQRPGDPSEVKARVKCFETALEDIEIQSLNGIDPMVDRAVNEADIDNKIENMMADLLEALSHIIDQHQERKIVVVINGAKPLMMVQTFVARLTKSVPNLFFVHFDYSSRMPSNLKNLKRSIFESVRISDNQVKYESPKGKELPFHQNMVNDTKMIALMEEDEKQGIGLGEVSNPTQSGFDSPTKQGVHNTIDAMKERGLLDDESRYTSHGIIVRATHSGRPSNRSSQSPTLGKVGVVMPIGVGSFTPEKIEEQIRKEAVKFGEQLYKLNKVAYIQPILIHIHDDTATGTYDIAQLPEGFELLKSHMEGVDYWIHKEVKETRNDCQVLDSAVMLIGNGSMENLSAGLLQILNTLPDESDDGNIINWQIFASTWVGAGAIVAADAMITLQIPSVMPFKNLVDGLPLEIPCSKKLLEEIRRVELLLGLKFEAVSKEKAYSCIFAAAMIQDKSPNPESCLKDRFKDGGEIRTIFEDVNLPIHWGGANRKIDGDLKKNLENHGWIEFGNRGSAYLLREGRILGRVLALHTNGG